MNNALYDSLKRLTKEGGEDNFIILHLTKHYYIQVAAELNSTHFLFETVSNHYLPINKQLSVDLQDKVIDLGWNQPQEKGNYSIEATIDSEEDYVIYIELIQKTAKDIFGIESILDTMIELYLN